MFEQIIFLVILIALSGFFSASEIAIFSMSPAKIKSLGRKSARGKKLATLKSKPQRLLINILIGNNLVNVASSALATVLAYEYFGSAGPAIAIGVLTVLILVFGEIGPKGFATAHAEKFALAVTPILRFLDIIFRPIAIFFEFFNKFALKFFTGGKDIPTVSEDEIRALAEIGVEEGVVENKEKEMIKRILEFNDINASDVMAVRADIFALPANLTIRAALPKINDSHYSRIPIYKESIDDIVGVVYLPDILREFSQGNSRTTLSKIARRPYLIPKQRKIDEIFKDFQHQKNHIAIVLDERGTTAGLVTLEDLLEEIVGEIMDESDINEFLIKRIDKNTILVDAQTEVREVNHFFNIKIPGDEHRFVSEVFLEKFGRIPKPGNEVDFKEFKMVVEKATAKKIEKVRIIKS